MADRDAIALTDEFFDLVRGFITRHGLTYQEYGEVMKYLISVGEAGEWPLFLDAFFEAWVNTSTFGDGAWTASAISGPYYKPGAPELTEPYVLPMRPDEPGEPLLFHARVTDTGGAPITGAELDVWHSTNDGIYSFFSPALPDEYLLRGRLRTGDDGRATFRSIVPVPYEIPKDGPTGYLMNDVLGRHSWRPAHLHFTITADGYQPLTTQLYFRNDPYLDSDSCSAVKPGLVIDLAKADTEAGPGREGEFTFALRTAGTHPAG
jgi:catechol 1,2-dioxygenase